LHWIRVALWPHRKISAELFARGHVTRTGKPHVASAVQKMLGQPHD
jgi:hypothetical protein